MPYSGQRAAKTGHSSFFESELDSFLKNCHYLRTITADERAAVEAYKVHLTPTDMTRSKLWASDGSRYVAAVQDGAPTTRIGYIKVAHVGFEWADYLALMPTTDRFVDPFALARIKEALHTVVWMLPGSNVRYKDALTARQGFRFRLHELLSSTKIESLPPLYEALFTLRGLTNPSSTLIPHIHIKSCPECHHTFVGEGLAFDMSSDALTCPSCGQGIYPSDILGFHRDFEEHGSNEALFTRAMSALEALMLAQRLSNGADADLSETLFFFDGLLGVYGEASWLAQALLLQYHDVKKRLQTLGLRPPLIVGIAKTGQLMHHAQAILFELQANDVVPVSLRYREDVLHQRMDGHAHPFNSKWGQDFIWRSGEGHPVVLSLPFDADVPQRDDDTLHDVSRYPDLPEILGALNTMNCNLYPSSFIPVVLAHEEASIAWEPGGRLLTEATKRALLATSSAD